MEMKLIDCILLILSVFVMISTSTPCTNQTGNEKNPFLYYSSPSFNPVNTITINSGDCCNETKEEVGHLKEQLNEITSLLTGLISRLDSLELYGDEKKKPFKDCYEIQHSGVTESGMYTIQPDVSDPFKVYCDMDTDRGGWTVFQRRENGSLDFYRDWEDYKNGFGSVDDEHWLGNENLYYLSNQKTYELRVDLTNFENETAYAKYATFTVTGEYDNYRLTVGGYRGNAGDSMGYHTGYQFSTRDADNDNWETVDCAQEYKGAWWYKNCYRANLNGLYKDGTSSPPNDGIAWYYWKNSYNSLKFSEMKLRPV